MKPYLRQYLVIPPIWIPKDIIRMEKYLGVDFFVKTFRMFLASSAKLAVTLATVVPECPTPLWPTANTRTIAVETNSHELRGCVKT